MSASEYFAAISTNVIRALKQPTRYGMLYDIDSRLRPYGNKGVLAVSSLLLETYYRAEAEVWERFVLVKGRCVAGEEAFSGQVDDIVHRCAFDTPVARADLERFEDIRRRVVAQASPLDIKKGEGGIAEIEFTVRMPQILHGRAHPEVKRRDVMGGLNALEDAGLMGSMDAATLREAYLLFRRVENRIRMHAGRGASVLPDAPDALWDLAERLEFDGDPGKTIAERRRMVHEVYEKVLEEASASCGRLGKQTRTKSERTKGG